jgi:hypothetical protein
VKVVQVWKQLGDEPQLDAADSHRFKEATIKGKA